MLSDLTIRRPLLLVCVLYGAGVWLADLIQPPLMPLLVSVLVLGVTCLIDWRGRAYIIGLLLLLAGAANLTLHTSIVSPRDLRRLVGEGVEDVALQGTLRQTPLAKTYEQGGETLWRTVAELEVKAMHSNSGGAAWQPALGRVSISTPGTLPEGFFAGQEVAVTGRLRLPKEAVAEGLFDYRSHLRRRGIYYQLQVASTNGWQVAPEHLGDKLPFTQRFVAWGKTALARGLPVEDESLRLEWALTLGWKTALTEEVSEPFIRAATYHIFAVDGLRIAIISGIFLSLFRAMRLSRALSGLLVIPLLWLYAYMTGFPASAIRATVMATIIVVGWALRRPSDVVNSLFTAALIILLWDPSQLFQAGFQLSFVVVLCIVLLMPVFQEWGAHLVRFDPWLPPMLRPRWQTFLPDAPAPAPRVRPAVRPLWERLVRACVRYFWEVFLVSMAAWLGSIPLAALYFHIFTPVSGPANLLAVPLCAVVLICNLLSLLLTPWFPFGAECYNHAGWFLMECIRHGSHWFERWPAAWCHVPAPSPATTGLYYLLLLTLATGWAFRMKHRRWILAGLALLAGAWCIQSALDARTTQVTIVPLKGAAAMFVDAPGRADDLLINCGNETSGEMVLKPFLQGQGVNHLARLVLAHGSLYLVGGTETIRRNFSPSQINLSPVRFRSAAYREFLRNLESAPGLVRWIQRGDQIGNWQVLHPARGDHFAQADDNTIVLRGEIRGTRVLLLSSLGKPGQNALFERQSDLRADVVVAGVPRQGEPLAEALLDAIQPRLIIIADVEYPATARASQKLRERLAYRRVPVVYTSQAGAGTLVFQRHGWQIRTMHPPSRIPEPPAVPGLIGDESE